MKQNQQPAALLAADALESIGRALGDIPSSARQIAIHELRHLHARNQELETMLDAVGAGGVSVQRVTQGKDHIAQDRKMVAAQETNSLLARIEKEISTAQINNHRMAAPFGKMEGEPCVRISSLLATIEGFLNEAADEQAATQEPFGYFKAEPFGWRDCAETDEGAIALYEAPQSQADALDAERYRWLRDEWLGNEPEAINMERAKGQRGLDAAIDAAIAAAKEKA